MIGVDIAPQPNFPFEFHQADAIEFIRAHGHEFDAISASPPCQSSSALTKGTNKGMVYPQLIPDTRAALAGVAVPTILENVAGAPIRKDLMLCGEMFGLGVLRHRFFEMENWSIEAPPHPKHRGRVRGWRHGRYFDGPYLAVCGEGGGKGGVTEWQQAMGIFHTAERKETAEAIPPAFTEYIGKHLLVFLEEGRQEVFSA